VADNEEPKIGVFIVDDHPLMRNVLEAAVESVSDMCVVGQAENGLDALALIPQVQPDVIIMDLMMPKMNGLQAIEALKKINAQYPVLALSSTTEEEKILRAVKLGARGYLSKSAHWEELIKAIRTIADGEVHLPPKIAGKLLRSMRKSEEERLHLKSLTKRQTEVLHCLGRGLSNQEITEELHITKATLRVHIHNMMKTLGFENRRELIVYAVRQTMDS